MNNYIIRQLPGITSLINLFLLESSFHFFQLSLLFSRQRRKIVRREGRAQRKTEIVGKGESAQRNHYLARFPSMPILALTGRVFINNCHNKRLFNKEKHDRIWNSKTEKVTSFEKRNFFRVQFQRAGSFRFLPQSWFAEAPLQHDHVQHWITTVSKFLNFLDSYFSKKISLRTLTSLSSPASRLREHFRQTKK